MQRAKDHIPWMIARGKPNGLARREWMCIGLKSPETLVYLLPKSSGISQISSSTGSSGACSGRGFFCPCPFPPPGEDGGLADPGPLAVREGLGVEIELHPAADLAKTVRPGPDPDGVGHGEGSEPLDALGHMDQPDG